MNVTQSYTPQCLMALRWYAEREPVGWFDKTAPSHTMRKSLERRGLIEPVRPKGGFGLKKYSLTEAGRNALNGAQR